MTHRSNADSSPGRINRISTTALVVPRAMEVQTCEMLCVGQNAPRIAVTRMRISPDVMIVWIEFA